MYTLQLPVLIGCRVPSAFRVSALRPWLAANRRFVGYKLTSESPVRHRTCFMVAPRKVGGPSQPQLF